MIGSISAHICYQPCATLRHDLQKYTNPILIANNKVTGKLAFVVLDQCGILLIFSVGWYGIFHPGIWY